MKITSWNVNSIRTRLTHITQWWDSATPSGSQHLLMLQETKVMDENFPHAEFHQRGLHTYIYGQKSYNGVALLSTTELADIQYGFPDDALNDQKRLIAATTPQGVRVVNVYCPQGQDVDSPKFEWKEQFYAALHDYLTDQLKQYPRLVIGGDFNIAPTALDVYDAQKAKNRVMFTAQEHNWLGKLLELPLHDTFRLHYPEQGGHYSWWDYRQSALTDNRGWRIDQLYASGAQIVRCTAAGIDPDPRHWEQPSDHVPISAVFV